MSKNKITDKGFNIEKEVMKKVSSGTIVMKPRWYFVSGGLLSIIGLISLSIASVFLMNIFIFSIRSHGPMGEIRLQYMLNSFPLWLPVLALSSIILGIILLKKFDFSYKNNFLLIIFGFIFSIFMAAFLIEFFDINKIWIQKGPMRKFYQGFDRNYQHSRGRWGKIIR